MPQAHACHEPVALLERRHSTPSRLLAAPGPDPQQQRRILDCALRVPDHGKLEPWRIVEIAVEAREHFSASLVSRHQQIDPAVSSSQLDKDRSRFLNAPWLLVVIGRIDPGARIPQQEQLLSGGCVCFSLLLAAEALGFAAQWLTGWAAYDDQIAQLLGLGEHERILGFIHIGSCTEAVPDRVRPESSGKFSLWGAP